MSNFENLKKQAKQYLRWHRERHYPVAAEIRAGLSRFRHLNDQQVLEAKFSLADAQELVARQQGVDGWTALKRETHAMTSPASKPTIHPVLTATEAMLYVADLKVSCQFFTAKLGFAVDFIYGDPPFYGMVKRDKARLCLRHVGQPVFVDDIRRREELLSASITVDTAVEIKQLYLDFKAAGVSFHQPLKKQPWGAKNFIVLDPDGNLILFAGPAE
jgi:catechol 2,3-dioxygenase-like lactoylglutathione lyase family enzyme